MPHELTHYTAASPGCHTVNRLSRRGASARRPPGESSRGGALGSPLPVLTAVATRSPRLST
eukprot:4351124-Alexandrium_andersonii.AAC.1